MLLFGTAPLGVGASLDSGAPQLAQNAVPSELLLPHFGQIISILL